MKSKQRRTVAGGVWVLGMAIWLAGCRGGGGPAAEVPPPQYVTGAVCAECHAEEAAAWTGSDHDLAMAPATPASVLGDFDDAVFTSQGVETRFFRRDGRYLVLTEGAAGVRDTFEVTHTFGVRPLQQYLVTFPDGRLQALTVAWDTERARWYTLYPEERIPPGDFLHWTGRGMNWNYMCAECHSTNLDKNFDLATNSYHTSFSEIDVSCEACHGPGAAHVAWAREAADAPEAAGRPYDAAEVGLTVDLAGARQVETCAPCHSRRRIVAADFTPGDRYLDHYTPELIEETLYFPDGQIKDEVYVYGSFLQSKMYHSGVRCADCHDPHTTRIKLQGNALCAQCHAPATYDTPAHHHHPDGTTGAACVACHMPERTYMGVDARRDHSFKVPRPDLTVELGVPNACTGCHTDQPAAWARDRVVTWYGPERSPTFARAVAGGRAGDPAAEQALRGLVQDAAMPALVRATAATLLAGYGSPDAAAAVRRVLQDPEPLVRMAAVRSYDHLPDPYPTLLPLLADSVRAVRVEAARVLARVARERILPEAASESARRYRAALAEYRQSQRAVEDQPEAHMNLGVLHEQEGDDAQAEAAYRTALRLDSTFVPARLNLAMLLNRRRTARAEAGRAGDAAALAREIEALLRAALRQAPEVAEVPYTLGLLLAEDAGRLPEAAAYLTQAARLAPAHARTQYNTGLLFQHLDDPRRAEQYLTAAYRLAPRNPDFLHALTILYMQQQQWRAALAYTDTLLQVVPGAPQLRQQQAYIRRQLGGR